MSSNENAPDVVVTAVRLAFVSRLMSVTVAPETSASDGSFTLPRMVDAPVWPQPSVAKNSAHINTPKPAIRIERFINNSFRAPSWVMKTTSRDAKRAESPGNMPKRAYLTEMKIFPGQPSHHFEFTATILIGMLTALRAGWSAVRCNCQRWKRYPTPARWTVHRSGWCWGC